ncbi:MAG: hypothetical protein ACR2MO_14350 [Acidimicrobiales bacterium]
MSSELVPPAPSVASSGPPAATELAEEASTETLVVFYRPRRNAVARALALTLDGVTWDDHTAAELAGRPVSGVVRASVVGERAIVALSVSTKEGARPRQLVLVGTPS